MRKTYNAMYPWPVAHAQVIAEPAGYPEWRITTSYLTKKGYKRDIYLISLPRDDMVSVYIKRTLGEILASGKVA